MMELPGGVNSGKVFYLERESSVEPPDSSTLSLEQHTQMVGVSILQENTSSSAGSDGSGLSFDLRSKDLSDEHDFVEVDLDSDSEKTGNEKTGNTQSPEEVSWATSWADLYKRVYEVVCDFFCYMSAWFFSVDTEGVGVLPPQVGNEIDTNPHQGYEMNISDCLPSRIIVYIEQIVSNQRDLVDSEVREIAKAFDEFLMDVERNLLLQEFDVTRCSEVKSEAALCIAKLIVACKDRSSPHAGLLLKIFLIYLEKKGDFSTCLNILPVDQERSSRLNMSQFNLPVDQEKSSQLDMRQFNMLPDDFNKAWATIDRIENGMEFWQPRTRQ